MRGIKLAKKGTKEPEGSDKWPTLDRSMGAKRPERDEPGHVPCYWSNHGHKELGIRTKTSSKYRENFDKIKWDK